MDIVGIVAEGIIQTTQKPAQPIVDLDVAVGVGEPGRPQLAGVEFVAGRVVRDVRTGPLEGGGATPPRAQNEDVHAN